MEKLCGGMEIQGLKEADYLKCAGICGEAFSQDGHNGADYLVVVPDAVIKRMKPYYSDSSRCVSIKVFT